MQNLFIALAVLLCVNTQITSAQNDSVRRASPSGSQFIVPAALIANGAAIRIFMTNRHNRPHDLFSDPDHSLSGFAKDRRLPRTHVDDYIQYLPYAAIYAVDLMGIPARHNFRDRSIVVGTSCIIFASVVLSTKHITKVGRPDGSNHHSFPSGHTATAFAGAHIFFREYRETLGWAAATGYLAAAATGSLRIWNRKHWYSDVLCGAGIGILSAELGYLILPVFHKMFKINDKKMNIHLSFTMF